jgi:hypothetical protein
MLNLEHTSNVMELNLYIGKKTGHKKIDLPGNVSVIKALDNNVKLRSLEYKNYFFEVTDHYKDNLITSMHPISN